MSYYVDKIRAFLTSALNYQNTTVEYAFYSFLFFIGLFTIGYFIPSLILVAFLLLLLVIGSFLMGLLIEILVDTVKNPPKRY